MGEQKVTGDLINHGFDESLVEIEKEAYILGVNSKLPTTIFRPDGEWPDITYEPQAEKYETSGCTIWGGENQTEMFVKEVYKFEPNYDERFNYLYCDVDPARGANPQNFYESVRHNGLIDNEPMPDFLNQFLDKSFLTDERIQKGKSWLTRWSFWHDWLSDTSKETIKGTLPLSPVAVSVTAWFRDEFGLYIDNGRQNTHWCVARGYVKPGDDLSRFQVNEAMVQTLVAKGKIVLKVFDSYDHSWKLLHPDHRIAFAKRIYVEPKDEGEVEVLQKSGIIAALEALIKKLTDYIATFSPAPVEPKPVEKPRSKIQDWALAIQHAEGGKPTDLNTRLRNPGNLKVTNYTAGMGCKKASAATDGGNFCEFETYEMGFKALCTLLKDACEGKLISYEPDMTLEKFTMIYANVPAGHGYIKTIAQRVGVPLTTPIKHLL